MSGGVDSSAAAVLLQQQGYTCGGAMLDLLPEGNDAADARSVAQRPLYPGMQAAYDEMHADIIQDAAEVQAMIAA